VVAGWFVWKILRWSKNWQKGKNKQSAGAGDLLPPGLEPETFASPITRYEVLVRRSNQLSYGSLLTVVVGDYIIIVYGGKPFVIFTFPKKAVICNLLSQTVKH
jgi:hypothetical protein